MGVKVDENIGYNRRKAIKNGEDNDKRGNTYHDPDSREDADDRDKTLAALGERIPLC